MYPKLSPGRSAVRDFALCLLICGVVALLDLDAVRSPARLAIMALVTMLVPALNYARNRRLARRTAEAT
jgi:hypothetical protein